MSPHNELLAWGETRPTGLPNDRATLLLEEDEETSVAVSTSAEVVTEEVG